jgi:DNA invertase Pin-like site-specific DNA recombinase
MIRQFLKDYPDMELEEIYCDEGYSGTNFVRPDFARLMQDIRSGRIECIIVKDFSRFGRNYIEAGYYLETVLPHLGVRFISINDRFDSAREEDRYGMAFPIKNMVNAMYAIDVSKKIVKGVELHNQLGDANTGHRPMATYLTGRTTPWSLTRCVKIRQTDICLVSDGLFRTDDCRATGLHGSAYPQCLQGAVQ